MMAMVVRSSSTRFPLMVTSLLAVVTHEVSNRDLIGETATTAPIDAADLR
jgi:hypothetical protein